MARAPETKWDWQERTDSTNQCVPEGAARQGPCATRNLRKVEGMSLKEPDLREGRFQRKTATCRVSLPHASLQFFVSTKPSLGYGNPEFPISQEMGDGERHLLGASIFEFLRPRHTEIVMQSICHCHAGLPEICPLQVRACEYAWL